MTFKNFSEQFKQNKGKKFHDIQIDLRYDYRDLNLLILQYIEEAKKLGSEEQLEQFISDIVNNTFSIGFAEAKLEVAQSCLNTMHEHLHVQGEYYEEQEHAEDCDCDECITSEDDDEKYK